MKSGAGKQMQKTYIFGAVFIFIYVKKLGIYPYLFLNFCKLISVSPIFFIGNHV